jgi:hypothetical protein
MRLDRDPVPRTQHIEKECRQKRNHRGAGCLMAADFEAITVLAQVICVVDDPTRQPEDLALQLGKQLQPVLFRCRGRLRPILRCLSHAVRSCTATMTSMIAVWRNDASGSKDRTRLSWSRWPARDRGKTRRMRTATKGAVRHRTGGSAIVRRKPRTERAVCLLVPELPKSPAPSRPGYRGGHGRILHLPGPACDGWCWRSER